MTLALDESKLWTGVFYRVERPTMQDRWLDIEKRTGHYKGLPELMDQFR